MLLSACAVLSAAAQQDDLRVIGRRASVTVLPVFQTWSVENGSRFSEFSTSLSLYYPVSRAAAITLHTSQAATGGDPTSISGLTDTQLGFAYHLERYNVVMNLGVNLPSGVRDLEQDEFATSVSLSNTLFDFRVPNFGQGVSINPGAVWGMPLNDDLVIGAGASYHYRGPFRPLKEFDDFDPGDEVLFTGGVDARLSATGSISADLVVTFYGSDKLGSNEVFASGNKIVANVRWRNEFGRNVLTVVGRYRTLGRDEVGLGGILVPQDQNLVPDQFEFLASYLFPIRRGITMGISGGGRFFQETPAPFTGASLFVLGLSPEFTVSSTVRIPVSLRLQAGSLKNNGSLFGLDIGAGLNVSF